MAGEETYKGRGKIGLIAGGGQFPLIFARAARQRGLQVVAVALRGETEAALAAEVDVCTWVPLGKLGRMIDALQSAGVTDAVMAGTVKKTKLYSKIRPDWKAVSLLARMLHKQDDALLRALAEELEAHGIKIRPSTLFLPELLAPPGKLTRRRLSGRERRDVEFGWKLAKDIGRLDIGQCLVVKDQAVLAVEAIEGTDETIRRGGRLGRGRAVVVKVSKPGQDLRFDVPAVGLQTIETMAEVDASVLVVEAGRTLMFDREEMIAAANRAGIAIVSRDGGEPVPTELEAAKAPAPAATLSPPEKRPGPIEVGTPPLPVGVVGVGYLGRFHAAKYAAMETAKLVAVVDSDRRRAQEVAGLYGCQACYSHMDLIGKVEAASVVVPTPAHYEVARDLLAAGIHVLVEKPMTVSLREADELIALAERQGLTLQVGHLERFNPAVVAARELVSRPLFVESHRLASFSERGTEVDVVLDLMIHDIDIILSFVSAPLSDIRAVGVPVLTRSPDIASARLEFADGCTANVTASRISPKRMRKIRIFQVDSYLSLDYAGREVAFYRKLQQAGADGLPEIEYQLLPVEEGDALEDELRAFVHAARSGQPPLVGGSDGRRALEVAIQVSTIIREQMEGMGRVLGLS